MKQFFAALFALAMLSGSAQAETVKVMAAFTMKNALDAVIQAYKADGGGDVAAQYGMTPMLARQVENMAPADVFVSADADWMNYLQDHGLIRNDTRVTVVVQEVVVVNGQARRGPQRQLGPGEVALESKRNLLHALRRHDDNAAPRPRCVEMQPRRQRGGRTLTRRRHGRSGA